MRRVCSEKMPIAPEMGFGGEFRDTEGNFHTVWSQN
jgi:hypothetical protein